MSKPFHPQNFKEYIIYYNIFTVLSIKIDFLRKFVYHFGMDCTKNKSCQAGKGDKPRNCFSNKYRKNYELINWKKKSKKDSK